MLDLFISECRRFRTPAILFATANSMLLLLANQLADILQERREIHLVILALYMLCGMAFALYQFGSYRQPARWIWLLHRPLPRWRVFAGVMLASALLIALCVGIPSLAAVGILDALTARTVDARHYLAATQLTLFTLIAWLAGSYIVLNRSKSAVVILVLPMLVLLRMASGLVLVPLACACVALLAFIVYGAFKPDRMAPPASIAGKLATAIPLQISCYFVLLWAGSTLFQYGQVLSGAHPFSMPAAPAGGHIEATRALGSENMLAGLAGSSDPRAAGWRRQIPLVKPGSMLPDQRQYPVRHMLSNEGDARWYTDAATWSFSHDDMRYQGMDRRRGTALGWYGAAGYGSGAAFPAPPAVRVANHRGYLVTPQQAYQIGQDTRQLTPRVALAGSEQLLHVPTKIGAHVYLVTNHRLLAYKDGAAGMWPEAFSVRLAHDASTLARVDVAELAEGTLATFTHSARMADGAGEARQVTVFVDPAGHAAQVGQRAMTHDFPRLFEHKDWWLSPVLHAVVALPDLLIDKGMVLDAGQKRFDNAYLAVRPAPVWFAALAVSLLSALAALWWLGPRGSQRRAWIAACLLLGPAAFCALAILEPRARREPAAVAQPDAVAASG
ncbi:hypothetical protein [Pseudoduganella namucuonensis]|uniref:Uncharacterized protein n=1 Tax=Pseudoduganella namucuonensis TaxID=1035707 RepID=A0A1I7KVU5_9BURK|nr:hypothetical protein [Pseudoduganella namucuonensis]SFV01508.1 hypothetical protein SAMN05216552_102033 [Pseudoduganella namucuonensis]